MEKKQNKEKEILESSTLFQIMVVEATKFIVISYWFA